MGLGLGGLKRLESPSKNLRPQSPADSFVGAQLRDRKLEPCTPVNKPGNCIARR